MVHAFLLFLFSYMPITDNSFLWFDIRFMRLLIHQNNQDVAKNLSVLKETWLLPCEIFLYRVYRFSAGCLTNTQIKNPAVVLIHKQTLVHGCWRVVAAKSQNSDSFCQLPSVSEDLWIFQSSVSFSVTLKLPNLKLPKPIRLDDGHGSERSFCFVFFFLLSITLDLQLISLVHLCSTIQLAIPEKTTALTHSANENL